MSGRERRKYRRVPSKDVAGHVRVKDEVLAMGLPIDNISMGGLFVRCTDPLPCGTPVMLELVRPYLEPLKLVGTVVASVDAVASLASRATPGMGVQFDALTTDTARKLSALLMTLLASPEKPQPAPSAPTPSAPAPVAASKRSALAAPSHNPANVNEDVVASRSAFDFGFTSLDPAAHDEPGPAFNIPRAPPPLSKPAPKRGSYDPPRPRTTSSAQVPVAQPVPIPSTPMPSTPAQPIPVAENARLLVQVRGLLEDLGETQAELARRAREIDELRDRLHAAFEDAMRKDERIRELERMLAARR